MLAVIGSCQNSSDCPVHSIKAHGEFNVLVDEYIPLLLLLLPRGWGI